MNNYNAYPAQSNVQTVSEELANMAEAESTEPKLLILNLTQAAHFFLAVELGIKPMLDLDDLSKPQPSERLASE